jgi:DUF917 family protein
VIPIPVDEAGLRALVYGGAVLGGGGGGSIAAGLENVHQALATGLPRIIPLAALADDAILVTLSAVGSPNQPSGAALGPAHFKRALRLFELLSKHTIDGYIASEVGPLAVTYGLSESASSGLPVVDAPANGRAHPLFVMGSLGMHARPDCATITVAVGGLPGSPDYVEVAIGANVVKAARIVRDRAARDGIALAVARNPLTVATIRDHAAVGGLAFAQSVGRALLEALARGSSGVLRALSRLMGGRVFAHGYVTAASLSEKLGLIVGAITILCANGSAICVLVCNEFMAVLDSGTPVVTFPDLIVLIDRDTGLPLSSAEIRVNRSIAIFVVSRHRLPLGSTMRDAMLLRPIEKLLGTRLTRMPSSGP